MVRSAVIFVVLVWLAVTVPLSSLGYGSDPDAWRVAIAADQMWQHGEYVRSRTLGFPLFELAVVPLVHFGRWFASNLLSVVGGLALIASLLRLARMGHVRQPVALVVMIAFAPQLLVNSAATMDYVPALALLMWAFVLAIDGRAGLAGLLIGLACGVRPTSGLFLVPIATLLIARRESWRQIATCCGVAVVVALAAYSPAVIKYGLSPVADAGVAIDKRALVLVGGYKYASFLGIPQTVIIFLLVILGLTRRTGPMDILTRFHIVNILVWTGLFVVLPMESAYLMPTLPSIALLLDRWTSRRTMWITVALLLSYNVVQFDVLGGASGRRRIEPAVRQGLLLNEVYDRQFKLSTRAAASECRMRRPTVLMFGQPWIVATNDVWRPVDEPDVYRSTVSELRVAPPTPDTATLARWRQEGMDVVLWSGSMEGFSTDPGAAWRDYVRVIDDLGVFLQRPIKGRPLNQR